MDEKIREAEAKAEHGEKNALNVEARREFNSILKRLKAIEKKHDAYDRHVLEVFGLIDGKNFAEARERGEKTEREEEDLDHELETLLRRVEEFTEESVQKVSQSEESAILFLSVVGLLALTFATSAGFLFGEGIFVQAGKEPGLRLQIFGLVVLMATLLAISNSVALFNLEKLGDEIKDIAREDIPLTRAVTTIAVHQLEQAILFERTLAHGAKRAGNRHSKKEFDYATEDFERLSHKVDKEILEAEKIAKKAVEEARSHASKEEYISISHHLKQIEKEHYDYEKHALEVFELFRLGRTEKSGNRSRKSRSGRNSTRRRTGGISAPRGKIHGLLHTQS